MEAGRDVHLQQPRLQLRVEEDVEAEELEAGVLAGHVGLVQVDQVALRAQHGLDHQILDLLPDDRVINPRGVEVSPQSLERPLVTLEIPILSITISSKYTCWYICFSLLSIRSFSIFTL